MEPTKNTTPHSEAQLEPPQQGVKRAQCEVFPVNNYYRVVIDFWNWDPATDGAPEELEKCLQEKCGKDNFDHFWWRKYPSSEGKEKADTRFMINVPYPAEGRMNGNMYQLISDAIYEYTGGAKIRIPVYMF